MIASVLTVLTVAANHVPKALPAAICPSASCKGADWSVVTTAGSVDPMSSRTHAPKTGLAV